MGPNDTGPKWVDMPSVSGNSSGSIEVGEDYHDLGSKYPDAPIPRSTSDIIVHRAILEDISAIITFTFNITILRTVSYHFTREI